MLVYEHVGSLTEKVHIHLVIEGSEYQKKWLRELGSRWGIDLKGNGKCSFKEFDGNRTAMVYMTKGELDPKFNKGYSEDDIALWKSQWVQQVETSPDARLYDQVFDEDNDKIEYEYYTKENPITPDNFADHKFGWLCKKAHRFVFNLNHQIWNLKAVNQYKMLVYSYCYRNGLAIPRENPVFKRFT